MFVPVVYLKGQYNALITRALRELGVESRLYPAGGSENILSDADALVIGGGPQSVNELTGPLVDASVLINEADVPVLCICVAHQLLAKMNGGVVEASKTPEFGPVQVFIINKKGLLENIPQSFKVWASHNDEVVMPPTNFEVLATSATCAVEAMKDRDADVYSVQFHPEVSQCEYGTQIFRNFLSMVKK